MTRAAVSGMTLTMIVATTATVGAAPKKTPQPNDKALVACENTASRPGSPRFCSARVLEVGSSGLTADRAETLLEALGLESPDPLLDDDGALRVMDAERFQMVPTIKLPPDLPPEMPAPDLPPEPGEHGLRERHVLDVKALKALEPIGAGVAVDTVSEALKKADLMPRAAGEARTDHATFELFANPDYAGGAAHAAGREAPEGLPTVGLLEDIVGEEFEIDTQVSYPLSVDGVPVVGPGAKVKVSFDPGGEVSQLLYSAVDIAGPGRRVQITPPELALDLCAAALDTPATVEATAELVYYAPALAHQVGSLLPHYSCGGESGEVVQRNVLIPAVVDAPVASVEAAVSGSDVTADVTVSGGTAPYTYSWSSQNARLDVPEVDRHGSSISYTVKPRTPTPSQPVVEEELLVTVVDANGLIAVGRADVTVVPATEPAAPGGSGAGGAAPGTEVAVSHAISGVQTGVEWVGTFNHQADLPGVPQNAQGFVDTSKANTVDNRFSWGNNNAYESDFKSSTMLGGGDHDWVDDVDMAFFTGHAGGTGWNLESNVGDNFVSNDDTRLGDRDLEWLVIGACGVLQDGFESRWGPTFKGLHMILGYATVSNDTTQEGSRFAAAAYSGRYLYQAWGQQAIDIQPSTVRYGYAGPVGYNGEWNAYDYFWGRGPVTADITNVYYLWRTTGNA